MAIVAVHRVSGARYVLLGVSSRLFTASRPLPSRSEEPIRPVLVQEVAACDSAGTIHWFRTEEVLVTEVDGAAPEVILAARGGYR